MKTFLLKLLQLLLEEQPTARCILWTWLPLQGAVMFMLGAPVEIIWVVGRLMSFKRGLTTRAQRPSWSVRLSVLHNRKMN